MSKVYCCLLWRFDDFLLLEFSAMTSVDPVKRKAAAGDLHVTLLDPFIFCVSGNSQSQAGSGWQRVTSM